MVERLLDLRAGLEARTRVGATPLFVACVQAEAACVELLLSRRADANATTDGGMSALAAACGTAAV
eukprot:5746774-Prymnesium_polylepis.1